VISILNHHTHLALSAGRLAIHTATDRGGRLWRCDFRHLAGDGAFVQQQDAVADRSRVCEPDAFHPLVAGDFLVYFLMPIVLQTITGSERPVQLGADRSAYITFIMFEAAYFCEIMRAGIQSISKGQVNAGYALGLTYRQSMQLVVLPQASAICCDLADANHRAVPGRVARVRVVDPPISSAPPRKSRSATAAWWKCMCLSPSCISCCAMPCRSW